jgi:ribosome-associated protein
MQCNRYHRTRLPRKNPVNRKKEKPLAGRRLADVIVAAAREKLAEKITVIELHEASTIADFFIICQSETAIQNCAIADTIVDRCSEKNAHPWHSEGEDEGRWIVIDFTDVVVHIMLPALRSYYSLETLWTEERRAGTASTGS